MTEKFEYVHKHLAIFAIIVVVVLAFASRSGTTNVQVRDNQIVEYSTYHTYDEEGDDRVVLYIDKEKDLIIFLNEDFEPTDLTDEEIEVNGKFTATVTEMLPDGFIIRVPDPGYVVAGLSGAPVHYKGVQYGVVSRIAGESEIKVISVR